MKPSNDELHAYVRGSLPPAREREIDHLAESDAELQTRIQESAAAEFAFAELAGRIPRKNPLVHGLEQLASWMGSSRAGAGGLLLATAALCAILVLPSTPPPRYVAELSLGEERVRSPDAAAGDAASIREGSRLKMVLRPSTRTTSDTTATVSIDGENILRQEARQTGAVVIEGTFGANLPALENGPHTLEVELTQSTWLGRTVLLRQRWRLSWSP